METNKSKSADQESWKVFSIQLVNGRFACMDTEMVATLFENGVSTQAPVPVEHHKFDSGIKKKI